MNFREELNHLQQSPSLEGKLVEEDADSITIKMANSLLLVPKEFILSRSDDKSGTVEVSLNKDAKIIQKTLVTPEEALIGSVKSNFFNRSQLVAHGPDDCSHTDCYEPDDCSRGDCFTPDISFQVTRQDRRRFRNYIRPR